MICTYIIFCGSYISINICLRFLYLFTSLSIDDKIDLIIDFVEIGPTVVQFFGKQFLIIKCNLKCSNNWKSDIFVSSSIKIFIFVWLYCNQLVWDSITVNS